MKNLFSPARSIQYSQGIASSLPAMMCLLLLALTLCGCRGRAHQDLYQQELQQEVRILEDELYEADYENRVLMEKLQRARGDADLAREQADAAEENRSTDGKMGRRGALFGGSSPNRLNPPTEKSRNADDLGSDFDEPPIDDSFRRRKNGSTDSEPTGSGVKQPLRDPNQNEAKAGVSNGQSMRSGPSRDTEDDLSDIDALIDEGELIPTPRPMIPPEQTLPSPQTPPGPKTTSPGSGLALPPAPGQPEPPGPNDFKIDPIEPGLPLPPNSIDGTPDGQPGKIELPQGLGMLGGLGRVTGAPPKLQLRPAKLHIDTSKCVVVPGQSGSGRRPSTAPNIDGVDLLVHALDPYGHPISVLGDVHEPMASLASDQKAKPRPISKSNATLSVVALDASKSGKEAQLGRWDFKAEKLRSLEQIADPGKPVKLPIRWRDKRPTGDAVVFFVRMQEGKRDLRCEAEISLKKQPSVAGWLPRR